MSTDPRCRVCGQALPYDGLSAIIFVRPLVCSDNECRELSSEMDAIEKAEQAAEREKMKCDFRKLLELKRGAGK